MIFFFFFYIFQIDSTFFFNHPSPPSFDTFQYFIPHIFSPKRRTSFARGKSTNDPEISSYIISTRYIEAREFEKFLPARFFYRAYFTLLTRIKSVLVENFTFFKVFSLSRDKDRWRERERERKKKERKKSSFLTGNFNERKVLPFHSQSYRKFRVSSRNISLLR